MLIDVDETTFNSISGYKMECIISKVHESVVNLFLYIFASVADLDSPCKGLQING